MVRVALFLAGFTLSIFSQVGSVWAGCGDDVLVNGMMLHHSPPPPEEGDFPRKCEGCGSAPSRTPMNSFGVTISVERLVAASSTEPCVEEEIASGDHPRPVNSGKPDRTAFSIWRPPQLG